MYNNNKNRENVIVYHFLKMPCLGFVFVFYLLRHSNHLGDVVSCFRVSQVGRGGKYGRQRLKAPTYVSCFSMNPRQVFLSLRLQPGSCHCSYNVSSGILDVLKSAINAKSPSVGSSSDTLLSHLRMHAWFLLSFGFCGFFFVCVHLFPLGIQFSL